MKIKVLYDISVLGWGQKDPVNRTGVFRVTESLAKALVNVPDIALSFSSFEGLETVFFTRKYFELNAGFYPQVELLDSTHPFQSFLRKKGDQVLSSLYPGNKKKNDGRHFKFIRQFSHYFNKVSLFFFAKINVPPDLLTHFDIFHSTVFPIPDQVKKASGVKSFITIYDLIPVLFPRHFIPGMEFGFKRTLNSIGRDTHVLAISQSTKNDLCNYLPHLDPDKVTVTRLAASKNFYPASNDQILEVRKKYHFPEGVYFLSLCTLEPRKNLEQVIRCFAKLVNEKEIGNDLFLVMAGTKGWLYARIFEEITHSQCGDRIVLTGYVEESDLASLYSGAIGFIYPSIYEGFGLPPLEAMQCGTPVITSNTSSLPEVVGDAGIMVDPHDTDELCQQMIHLYRDSELRRRLSEKAIQRAKQFTWERCARETVAAYQQAW